MSEFQFWATWFLGGLLIALIGGCFTPFALIPLVAMLPVLTVRVLWAVWEDYR